MTPPTIPTTPIPPALDAARHALAGITDSEIASRPDRLAASEALAVLSDVRPPYPPVSPTHQDVVSPVGLDRALDHLTKAIDESTSIPELTRIATAALVLRHRGGVAA